MHSLVSVSVCGYLAALCTPACQNGGRCVDVNKCTCVGGWQGARCQIGEMTLVCICSIRYYFRHALCSDLWKAETYYSGSWTYSKCLICLHRLGVEVLCTQRRLWLIWEVLFFHQLLGPSKQKWDGSDQLVAAAAIFIFISPLSSVCSS